LWSTKSAIAKSVSKVVEFQKFATNRSYVLKNISAITMLIERIENSFCKIIGIKNCSQI